jgi:phosphatidylserine decarboxylase
MIFFLQSSIELDKDLLANSQRSLETLVYMGMTVGVAQGDSYEAVQHIKRPAITDSVAALDHEVAQQGIQVTDSINVCNGHLGLETNA